MAGPALLSGKRDRYNGLTVSLSAAELALGSDEFAERLKASLARWRADGVRGVWLQLPARAAALVPAAVGQGFVYHHARPSHLMLTHWLSDDSDSHLPPYPHHQIGVAGMVLSGDGERVLAIQEKRGITAGRNFWKLPGGLVDPGEGIRSAVEREVEEETGVRADFRCIAAFRETHQGPFGCTDLYCVCVLQLPVEVAASGELPEPQPQEEEVARAEWISLEDFLGAPHYRRGLYGELLRRGAAAARQLLRGGTLPGLEERKLPSFPGRVESLYAAKL
eukprot:TRINITY_DN55292_c0_g1_i1.p1 TRINITY_DN55292_c0_g1~~TRINITY_DN55292_c0_g1_i1.p1  ORF type:complete len:278 (+),score=37.63 TRINITY_DN55292_c0_g1_i1:85-918(+)